MNLVLYYLSWLDEKRQPVPQPAVEVRTRERLGPGGLRGLQIRREALGVSSVGSTPIRSRQQICLTLPSKVTGKGYLPGLFRW